MSVTAETYFIVDYDLPVNNSRRSFYRHIKSWLKKHGSRGTIAKWSSQSVIITQDKEFAKFVFEQAALLGHANLYEARLVQTSLSQETLKRVSRETGAVV
jgi:uncharacterized protein YjbI with pentapeptide repeats